MNTHRKVSLLTVEGRRSPRIKNRYERCVSSGREDMQYFCMEKRDEREIVNEFLRSAILKTEYERKASGVCKAPERAQDDIFYILFKHEWCVTIKLQITVRHPPV